MTTGPTPADTVEQDPFRAGFVALVGRPNVGKSTLLNRLLDFKLAIVSPKPQTTRTRIHGILNRPDAQVVLVDTPGVCDNRSALRRAMRRMGAEAAADADITVVLVEPRGGTPRLAPEDRDLVRAARQAGGQVLVALNKIDTLRDKAQLLPWMKLYSEALNVDAVVPISGLTGDGLEALLDELIGRLPAGAALFPPEMVTDQAERLLCGEIVREQVLLQLHDEVPHSVAVVIEVFEDARQETSDAGSDAAAVAPDDEAPADPAAPVGRVHLEGRIYVERDSQKAIVIGKGGRQIKAISTAARRGIEELLGCPVYLRLTVHVDKLWTRDTAAVRRYGIGGEA